MVSRIKFFRSILACCFFTGGVLPAVQSGAQSPAPSQPAPSADPAQDAAKRAFESLPDADRIAIQDGLIWTGDYKGIADGKFGKGTRDAIAAFATRNKLPSDGTLDVKGRAALAAAAKQAKEAVNFSVKADDRTGLRIGLPLKLLTKVKPLPTGTRYSSADESVSIETTHAADAAPLQESFNAAIADAPGRKVTYKVLRPDFYVVTGEAGGATFYTRMARGEAGVTGYTITYPAAAKARFDPISIAVANSFVPFPDPAAPATTAAPMVSPSTPASANIESAAGKPVLTASGVSVAPGLILTSLPHSCGEPQINGKKAKIMKQDDAIGLTLLSLAEAPGTHLPLRATDPVGPAQIVTLSFMPRANADELVGASGDFHKAEAAGAWRLLAPLQSPVAGAAVLDRSGALAGLVPLEASLGKPISGVLPQMTRIAVPVSKLSAFLAEAKPKPSEHVDAHTTGEIVALGRAAMVPIYCAR
jgi:peptidoglycan hydrolase-like protein with peptidoglycan-binding domain